MTRLLGKFLIASCLLAASQASLAQRTNISIAATTEDDIGRQLASRIRQKVAAAPLMTYVSSDNIASLRLRLVTLDPDDGTSQNFTVYSQVIVLHPKDGPETFLSTYVGTCGRTKVDQCADSIVAQLDEWADAVRKIADK